MRHIFSKPVSILLSGLTEKSVNVLSYFIVLAHILKSIWRPSVWLDPVQTDRQQLPIHELGLQIDLKFWSEQPKSQLNLRLVSDKN